MTDIPTVPEPAALPRTSRLAIASLLCSLGAICLPVLCGVLLAVIFASLGAGGETGPENAAPHTFGIAIMAMPFLLFGGLAAGIILGIAALVGISRKKGSLKGRGLAIAGIVIGGLIPLLLPFLGVLIFFRREIAEALGGG